MSLIQEALKRQQQESEGKSDTPSPVPPAAVPAPPRPSGRRTLPPADRDRGDAGDKASHATDTCRC